MTSDSGNPVSSTLSSSFARLLPILRKWFWPGLATIAMLAFILAVVKPFANPPDPEADDIATAWNESIQRLGIFPVYPPAEDIYVGDVWAIISQVFPEATTQQAENELKVQRSTLLGKSVRIGYIDLRSQMVDANKGHPVFDTTTEPKLGYRPQTPFELPVTDTDAVNRIRLSLAAFPGVTITHKTKLAASTAWAVGEVTAARGDDRLEEIRIPVAETYGVPTAAAFYKLDQWCADPKTKILCSDEYVRRIMAYAVSNKVLATNNNSYTTQIELRLITRVYLMREIVHRRLSGIASDTKAQVGKPADEGSARDAAERSTDTGATPRDAANVAVASGAKISAVRADGVDIFLNEVFQRPLVFGFRAITIDLTPSQPGRTAQ
jgi:hypothetical protein